MKKLISIFMVIIILFNFIFCNNSFADDDTVFEGTTSIVEDTISSSDMMGLTYDGSANGTSMVWGILGNITGAIAGTIAIVINIFPMMIQVGMMIASDSVKLDDVTFFTIERAVFNEIPIFNIDYFDYNDSYTIGNTYSKTVESNSNVIKTLKKSVAKFYYILRLISIAISLIILIYVGIRMAISTIAEDKAKYKKMFMGWLESILLLFVMQYIMIIIIKIGNVFGDVFYDFKCILEKDRRSKF